MLLGEKLAMLRRQNNYTQEQLAELLCVSRQAVSKWESGLAYPETEKLIRLSELYDCSIDYLIKDKQAQSGTVSAKLDLGLVDFERKSRRMVCGVPLWHINIGAGRTAKGIFALGFAARGVFSCGLFSLGLLAFGALALGIMAFGAIAAGIIALGGVAVGVLALGGCAIGLVSAGGAAVAQYLAVGDSARARVAVGITKAYGEVAHIGAYSVEEYLSIMEAIKSAVPQWLTWAAEIVKIMI